MVLDTATVVHEFNAAFQQHDPGRLANLIGDECVLENTDPAPDGARFEGRQACLGFWQDIAQNPAIAFELEDVIVTGERATILWRLRFSPDESVRGVNLMTVRDGTIVEALGYVKGV